jgi:hypothetical protein
LAGLESGGDDAFVDLNDRERRPTVDAGVRQQLTSQAGYGSDG